MGPTALLPLRRSAEDFFALQIRRLSAGCEPANLGTKGQHAISRPPKPLINYVTTLCYVTQLHDFLNNVYYRLTVDSGFI